MEDEREVETTFQVIKNQVLVTQKIKLEEVNSTNSQAFWWKTILINFKKHIEK